MQTIDHVTNSALENSEALLTQAIQKSPSKLSMVWVKRIDNDGRDRLVAVLTLQD
jgi:hypothetical protein